jgi:uncharacterized protein (DUF1778 family)
LYVQQEFFLLAHIQTSQAVSINIRAKAKQRDLIDQAAESLGRSRSDFMLEAACTKAQDVLLDQTFFALEPEAFAKFQALLDAPPAPNARLQRFLSETSPWDKK